MYIDYLKKNKKIVIFLIITLAYLLICSIAYKAFGHQLIKAMYEGKSIGILNKIMEIQSAHTLGSYLELADRLFFIILLSLPLFLLILTAVLRPSIIVIWPKGKEWLDKHTDAIDAIPIRQLGLWIALAAGLSLFTELMIIRLHSSFFQLFAYFKNVSLLACFLGLGIGYARASRRPLTTPLVLPLLTLQIVFVQILRFNPIAKFLQNPISEQLTMAFNQAEELSHILIVYGFLILIFIFNALCFVPLGHLISRLMMRQQKLIAYSWNLIGSLGGIVLFSLISFIWAPPIIWIVLAAVALMIFIYKDASSFVLSVFAVIILVIFLTVPIVSNQFEIYSPYQLLTLTLSKNAPLVVKVSNTYYQTVLDLSEENVRKNEGLRREFEYYSLPYYFKPKPGSVLIVGSGVGNDVAAAVRNSAGEIDAVEIDPAILQLGKQLHPEFPYQASNVKSIVNDARAFIRSTDKQYDLIVYGLLDSHSLLSGISGGIRLDSYVYTVEAFKEAKSKLKDDGLISLTFALIKPELGHKLFLMLQEAFDGRTPIVYRAGYDGGYTFLIGGGLDKHSPPKLSIIQEVTKEFSDNKIRVDKSTDNWPFFYMPVRKYPVSYVIMLSILLIVSIALIYKFVSGSARGFSIPCFFLGAGFMLIETKGITELALVYGSTWIVISVVIGAILIMGFLANLLVMKGKNLPRLLIYGLLFISLIIGLSLTFVDFSKTSPWLSRLITTVGLTFPLFFSGFVFSNELKKAPSVAVALSSNLMGAMLGGFLEYNSMYFGFQSLYIFALVMYGLALLGSITRAK